MYPRTLNFVALGHKGGPIALGWEPTDGATGFLFFRSIRPVDAQEMESLYQGALKDDVTTVTLPRATKVLLDDEWIDEAWYAVLAMTSDGDLVQVPIQAVTVDQDTPPPGWLRMSTVRAVGPPSTPRCGHQGLADNIYETSPTMVYREDTPTDSLRLKAIESALSRRFDDQSSD